MWCDGILAEAIDGGQTPGDSEGEKSLAGCSPWAAESQTQLSDWTTIDSNQSTGCMY